MSTILAGIDPYTPTQVTGIETRQLVNGRFDISLEQALSFTDLARTAISDLLAQDVLVDVIGKIAEIIQNMDSIVGFAWIANPLAGHPLPSPVIRPVLDETTINTYSEPFYQPTSGEYSGELVAAIKDTLPDFITGRETGIDPAVEQQEYNLLMLRQSQENDRRYAQADAADEALGWCVPQASFISSMAEVANIINQKNTEINLGIYVEHEKMIQQNRQFSISSGTDLEKALMTYKQDTTKTGIELYRADVTKYIGMADAEAKYADARSKRNDSFAKLYEADIKDRESIFESITKAFSEEVREAIGRSETYLKREASKLETWAAVYKTKDEIVRAWAAILAQIASAIWGSVSASAALHYNESRQDSTSQSRSYDEGYRESETVNWNISRNADL